MHQLLTLMKYESKSIEILLVLIKLHDIDMEIENEYVKSFACLSVGEVGENCGIKRGIIYIYCNRLYCLIYL